MKIWLVLCVCCWCAIDKKIISIRNNMWGSFIAHVSFLWEILFRKCGEGKYVGSFLSYLVEVGIY